ncbi:acyl-CoA dehydrogenase family protein [Sulfolobus sp. S-194]|uniref:acyl-CoA dehydrogenase family protein n=1 Tax=Sulfolobus sp. S-194 TaxID=2512240 RepID=UPI001438FFC6|nr:acyl-CoA dehydrogenase family protein [Sulfolobus sp. S-194]
MIMNELILSSVKEFVKREIEPLAEKIDREDYYPRELVRKMGELGYLSPLYEGLTLYDTVNIIEEIAKASGSVALIQDAQGELVTEPIRMFGNKEQKEILDKLAKGELIGGFGLSEPCCGSDAGSIITKAERVKGSWVINGRKMWTTQGLYADIFLIVARTGDPKLKEKTLTVFLVPRNKCITTRKIEVMGNRGTGTAEIELNDCEVGEDSIVGELNGGWRVVKYALLVGRIAISAIAIGLSICTIEEAIQWSKQRELFGSKLIEKQGIQWYLAKSVASLYSVESMVREISKYPLDKLFEIEGKISALKFVSSNIAENIIDTALQIMGGLGYAKGSKVERAFRDVRLTRIGEGTDEVQLSIINKVLMRYGIDKILDE